MCDTCVAVTSHSETRRGLTAGSLLCSFLTATCGESLDDDTWAAAASGSETVGIGLTRFGELEKNINRVSTETRARARHAAPVADAADARPRPVRARHRTSIRCSPT